MEEIYMAEEENKLKLVKEEQKVPKSTEELIKETIEYLNTYKGFQITSNEQYVNATDILKDIKSYRNRVELEKRNILRPLDEARDRIMTLFRPVVDRLDMLEKSIKKSMSTYKSEVDRKRKEEEADKKRKAREEEGRIKREFAKKAAEEERKRAELERQRLEEERKRKEIEKQRLEEERKRAELERQRLEEERKKKEFERQRIEAEKLKKEEEVERLRQQELEREEEVERLRQQELEREEEAERLREQERDAQRKELELRVQEEAADQTVKNLNDQSELVVVEPEPVTIQRAPKVPGIGYIKVYNYKVINEDDIPKEWLMVNDKKIKQAIRQSKGQIKISGIEVYEDNSVRSRSY